MQTTPNTVRGAGTHLVQFYEADGYLCEVVAAFLADGLVHGEPAVVIATEEHRRGFAEQLAAKGFDAERVQFIDARTLMSTFIVDGVPDEQRFLTLAGGMLEELTAGAKRPRVRAYGEMVDLLWRDGNSAAAIRLEQLWNELGTLYPITLLCAYPIANFYKESDALLFGDVCAEHGRVLPAESYNRGADDDTRLREIAALQQRAAALEAEIARGRELERSLLQNNRTKDDFLAALSHELRTPLTAILGWARMLSLGTLDAETTRVAVETIEQSARAQAAMVDDLLDLSRVVTGKLKLRSQPVDLRVVVEAAVETMRLGAEARGIGVRVSNPPQHCVVTGDATRLQQIAWTLLSNAVKFSPNDSEVAVTVECIGEQARLTVRDAGKGITSEFLPHVFEPFRQGDGASTRAHNGLGLGLAIVKYLTELHGGTVVAASEGDGLGSTFTVTLPLA